MSFFAIKSAVLRTVAALALVASVPAAHAAHFLYTDGHGLDGDRLAALGHTYTSFQATDAGWTAALAGEYGAFSAILVGEATYSDVSLPVTTAIANYVKNGGRIIIGSDHMGNVAFTNAVFGYNLVLEEGCHSDDTIGGTRQAGAAGTPFAAGPGSVGNLSCTSTVYRTSVPSHARTIYAGTNTAYAFAADYGTGALTWLGYDFCCGDQGMMDDWYLVFDNALKFNGLFTTCAAQGYNSAKLTLCRQICEVRQSPATLQSLTKAWTTLYRSAPPCAGSNATIARAPTAYSGGYWD